MGLGGGNSQAAYDASLAEQEHRKKLAEAEARTKSVADAKANALSEAEAAKRKKAFLSKTTKDDDDKLGGTKNLLG